MRAYLIIADRLPSVATEGRLVQSRTEASLGRCWARASNPAGGTLYRWWVRHPLASASTVYCLSKTNIDVNVLPSPFVPVDVVVMVLPPFEITVRPVAL